MDIRKVNVIWYQDLENLIEEEYGVKVSIQACIYPNNSFINWDVITDASWNKPANELIREWLDSDEKEYEFDLVTIGADLGTRNILPSGEYLILVRW